MPLRQGGGGYQISTTFGARYRLGLTHRFFIGRGGLNIFPESKNSNGRSFPVRIEVESFQAVGRHLIAGPASLAVHLGELFSRAWGVVKSLRSADAGPVGKSVFFAAELAESFFGPPSASRVYSTLSRLVLFPAIRTLSAKTPRNSGWGGWS